MHFTSRKKNPEFYRKSKKKYQDQIEKHCYNFYHCIVLFLHSTVILCYYYYYCLYHVFYYSMLYLHLYFSLLFNNTKIFFKNNDIKLHHCQNHEKCPNKNIKKRKWIMSKMIIERSENSIKRLWMHPKAVVSFFGL